MEKFIKKTIGRAALIMAAAVMGISCTEGEFLNHADKLAAEGGTQPGVVLQLTPTDIFMQGAIINTDKTDTRAANDNTIIPVQNSSITVELIDKNGAVIDENEGNAIRATFTTDDGTTWTPDPNTANNLYVTGGAGHYRMRAYGSILTADKGIVGVGYAGVVQVTQDATEPTKGCFSFKAEDNSQLRPRSSAIRIILKDTQGLPIEDPNGDYQIDFTGVPSYSSYTLTENSKVATATEDIDFVAVGRQHNMSYNTDGITTGNIIPGTYPAASASDRTLFTIKHFENQQEKASYTVKAPADTRYTFEPGKLHTFNLRINGSDISIISVSVMDFQAGEGLESGVGTTPMPVAYSGSITDFVEKYDQTDKTMLVELFNGKTIELTDVDLSAWGTDADVDGSYAKKLRTILWQLNDASKGISISMPRFVAAVPSSAFNECAALVNISLPLVTQIKSFAFNYCTRLASISLGRMDMMGANVFYNISTTNIVLTFSCTPTVAGHSITDVGGKGENTWSYQSSNDDGTLTNNTETHTFASIASKISPTVETAYTGTIKAFVEKYQKFSESDINAALGGKNITFVDVDARVWSNIASTLSAILNKITLDAGGYSISMPNFTDSVPDNAFKLSSTLTAVDMPQARALGECAFSECAALTDAKFAKATEIGKYAFFACFRIVTVNCPAVTDVGDNAFHTCQSLTSLTLGVVKSVGAYAFSGTLRDGVTPWTTACTLAFPAKPIYGNITGKVLWAGKTWLRISLPPAPDWEGSIVDFINTYKNYIDIELIPTFNGKTIEFAEKDAVGWKFSDLSDILIKLNDAPDGFSLSMPNFEGAVAHNAFTICSSMKSVNFPKAKSIEIGAFNHCYGLTTVNCAAAKTICEHAFDQCFALTTVNCSSATAIYDSAFIECKSLTSLTLGGIKELLDAFNGFENSQNCALVFTAIPSAGGDYDGKSWGGKTWKSILTPAPKWKGGSIATFVKTYSNATVYDLIAIFEDTTIEFNDIDDKSWIANKQALQDILFDMSLKMKYELKTTKGYSISMPNFTGTVPDWAFYLCSALKSISLPKATYIGTGAFAECDGLAKAYYPEARIIKARAFYQCYCLTYAGNKVATEIGDGAYLGCPLTTADFPAVTAVWEEAFRYCHKLTNLTLGGIEHTGIYTFYWGDYNAPSVHLNCTLTFKGEPKGNYAIGKKGFGEKKGWGFCTWGKIVKGY